MVGITLSDQESLIRRRLDRRGLSLEVVVVLVCGLLGAAGKAYVALEASNGIESPLPYMNFTLIGYIAGPILMAFGVWALYTLTAHFLANSMGGRGPISRLSRATAWSIVPVGVWLLIQSIVQAALFFTVDVPASPDGFSAREQLANVLELGLESPLYFAVFLLGLAFVAWSWHLLSVGIAGAKDVSVEKARKIAAAPAGVLALAILWMGIQWWTPI